MLPRFALTAVSLNEQPSTRCISNVRNKVSALNLSYSSGYLELHSQFNMPKREDFGFILRETTGKEIFNAVRGNGNRADVLSREIPVQILYSNGTLNYAILNVRTW